MEKQLDSITPIIAKVADGENITSKEAGEAFRVIFLHDRDGYHFAVFMTALHAKGETSDELLGLINVFKELSTPLKFKVPKNTITDLSGTGGGRVKTINVSTLASFVVAAAGYKICKASYYGVTSPTGSADIFANFGIDISKLNKEVIEETVNDIGICPFYVPFFSPKLENRGQLFKKVYRDHQLKIKTTAHIATNVFSPFPIKQRIYGCYSEKYLHIIAELFAKLGYERTLTFSSASGIPEIANIGETLVFEQNKDKIKQYVVTPNDLNIKEAKIDEITSTSKEQNIKDFIQILKGKETGAKAELVAINAGAGLYVLKDVKSIQEGFLKAKRILQEGNGYQVFERLVNKIGNSSLLLSL